MPALFYGMTTVAGETGSVSGGAHASREKSINMQGLRMNRNPFRPLALLVF